MGDKNLHINKKLISECQLIAKHVIFHFRQSFGTFFGQLLPDTTENVILCKQTDTKMIQNE